jgi:3-oxoacyl-[acyl-carrier protein] reductase
MFAKAGSNVVLPWWKGHPHDPGIVARAVEAHGRRALVCEADVSSSESVESLVAATLADFGKIDVVIANAAISPAVSATDLTDDEFLEVIQVDLLGVFRTFRAVLPTMLNARWGRLLATSSTAGAALGWRNHVHYTAAKAGVVGLVRSLALEVAPQGITVNAVVPGLVPTPQSLDPVNSLGPEGVAAFQQHVPIGRNGAPADIAAAFLFLASEEAAWITGQALVVDGGMTINPPG